MWSEKPSIRLEINNFSRLLKTKKHLSGKKPTRVSDIFVSGGCEWCLEVCPKGYTCDDHMSLYLNVGNSDLLQTGWKRDVKFYFVVKNQSGTELFSSSVLRRSLCAEEISWGFSQTLPHSIFQEKGFLENDKLFVEVYIDVLEAFDGESGANVSKKEEIVDIKGFQVSASQAGSVRKIFAEHPEFAKNFKPKNQVVKTEYMNVLLKLIETLEKPQTSLSKTKRKKARRDLTELIDAGFKLDWLKSKLELEVVSLESEKASDPDESRIVQQPKEHVSFQTRVEELNKNADDDWSRVIKLEKSLKNLEWSSLTRDYLNARLEDVSEEIMLLHEDAKSRVRKLEKSVKNLELIVSNLTTELAKEKAKSSVDDFLLVDRVD